MFVRNLACALLFIVSATSQVLAQDSPKLLQSMSGTWSVEQRNWTGANSAPVEGPSATAERRLVDGKFLQESMRSTAQTPNQEGYFVRDSTINYNVVSKVFEYFSIDTRAPQAMTYKSGPAEASNRPADLKFTGGTFLAPKFGNATNVRFKYRIDLGKVQDGKQILSLYFTPLSGMPRREFLATQYRYVKQP